MNDPAKVLSSALSPTSIGVDPPDKRRRPRTGNARALSFPDEAAAGINYVETIPTASREEESASLNNEESAPTR
jgi:hypothetical protein